TGALPTPGDSLQQWILQAHWQELSLEAGHLNGISRLVILSDNVELLTALNFSGVAVTRCLIGSEPEYGEPLPAGVDKVLAQNNLDYDAVFEKVTLEWGDCVIFALSYCDMEALTYHDIEKRFQQNVHQLHQWMRHIHSRLLTTGIRFALLNWTQGGKSDLFQAALSKYYSFLRYEYFELNTHIIHLETPLNPRKYTAGHLTCR
ncbi:MAG: hypothetical protein P8Y45_20755, partial [Exilibacterium sp.]